MIKAGPLGDFDGVDLLKVESQRKWEAERCYPPRLGSFFGRVLVGDAIHDAVGEGDAIDSLGKNADRRSGR